MAVDRVLLDQLYRARLVQLRDRAEAAGLPKNGSVEVLRARLIQHRILPEHDLSWDGIQSMAHQELGKTLKVFGIKSSGSHKERRQRLWLHLNFDSRRLTVERLAEMEREKLHKLCQKLELLLTGTRTVLMGRVSGVLASQGHGWGQVKKSLRRNGLPDISSEPLTAVEFREREVEEIIVVEVPSEPIDFLEPLAAHVIEDASDNLIAGSEKISVSARSALQTLKGLMDDVERMVGTILNSHGGRWAAAEENLFIRIAQRKGWPIENEVVQTRLLVVAARIAEEKGAKDSVIQAVGATPVSAGRVHSRAADSKAIERIRAKMTHAEQLLAGLR